MLKFFFFFKYEVDAEKEFSIRRRRRITPKHLNSNKSNASKISFHAFYRKEFKSVLDKLNGLIRNHHGKFINDIKPLYNTFKPPFRRNLLTKTLIQDAMIFLPNNIEIDSLTSM